MYHDAARADFDTHMAGVGLKRVASYANHRTHTTLECSRGHRFDTTPNNMRIKYDKDTITNIWCFCPECSMEIKRTLRFNSIILSARQRGWNAEFVRGTNEWKMTCDHCDKDSPKNPLRVIERYYGCDCRPVDNTIWMADDGVNAFLWIGHEPAFIALEENINVYPVFGQMVGKNFEIDPDAPEEVVAVAHIYQKELMSKARTKAVKMLEIAKQWARNQFTILEPENHTSWGGADAPDSALTRAMLAGLDTDYFWIAEKYPPMVKLEEVDDTPDEDIFDITYDSRIPDTIRDNNSIMELLTRGLDGDVRAAHEFGRAVTSGADAAEDRSWPKDSDPMYKYTFQPQKRLLNIPEGRWSTDKCKAIIDAALAASSKLYGGRYNKDNVPISKYIEKLGEEEVPKEDFADPFAAYTNKGDPIG
jgi:hypothetical protein